MPFFKSTPNLPDGEKARIELHFQQLAEHLGFDKFTLPIKSEFSILDQVSDDDPCQVRDFVLRHLSLDVEPIQIQFQPELPVKKSGGGG